MFHQFPPSSYLLPQPPVRSDVSSRRKSDTVICDADSSGSYLPNSGKGEVRRSSEPVRQARAPLMRLEPSSGPANREATPMPNLNETELMYGDVDPQEFDANLNPQGEGQVESTVLHPPSGNKCSSPPLHSRRKDCVTTHILRKNRQASSHSNTNLIYRLCIIDPSHSSHHKKTLQFQAMNIKQLS